MKKFTVEVPFTGRGFIDVEAETEKDAIGKALNIAEIRIDVNNSNVVVDELEVHDRVVGGNVFYGCLNEASAEEIK